MTRTDQRQNESYAHSINFLSPASGLLSSLMMTTYQICLFGKITLLATLTENLIVAATDAILL